MGDVYTLLKQYNEAIAAFNKGLEIEPTNVRAIQCRVKIEGLVGAEK